MSQIENPGEPLDGGRITEVITTKLADEQLAVLETAYELGYFDVPRTASTNDIAGALDVSQSTATNGCASRNGTSWRCSTAHAKSRTKHDE